MTKRGSLAPAVKTRGFTLVEMLVVVIVILLLSAVLLKSVAHFGEEARRKKCVADLQALKNALNEYYTAYGTYPIVKVGENKSSMGYEYECLTNQPPAWRQWLDAHNDPSNRGTFFLDGDLDRFDDGYKGYFSSEIKGGLGYSYGLVAFLWPRDMGEKEPKPQKHPYDKDTDRDKAVKGRIANFLRHVSLGRSLRSCSTPQSSGMDLQYSNTVATVMDPWDREYIYECPPPHRSYRLWSNGPDGVANTSDDVSCGPSGGSWSE
ncbi:MAG: type II secretion system protein GspG [Verrucomicrobiota bacterium]|nr:type II secretion system protein GspG [Verrucomicrobiota bacterium]